MPELNDLIRGLAAQENVPLVDLYQALVENAGEYIGGDGLHPTQSGYIRIAQAFFDSITQTLELSPSIGSAGVRGRSRLKVR